MASAPVWASVPSAVGTAVLDAVSVTTALSDGETDGEEVVSPWFGIGLSDVDSSAGLSDGFSEVAGSGVVPVVLALVTVTVTGLPGFAVKLFEGLYRSYPSVAVVCLTQK